MKSLENLYPNQDTERNKLGFYIKSLFNGWYSVRSVSIRFEPRDLWIGLYWTPISDDWLPYLVNFRLYLCIIPMLPIVIELVEREP